MKKQLKRLALCLAGLTLGGVATFAQTAAPTPAAQAEQEQQRIVRVATLNSVEANQEFQRNVQILQARRQQIVDLQSQLERAASESARERIQDEIDEALARLNDDNQTMIEAYGFSLNRNYTMVVERSHIFMFVSEEEAALIEAEAEAAEGQE